MDAASWAALTMPQATVLAALIGLVAAWGVIILMRLP
jgi:hypothetical protein